MATIAVTRRCGTALALRATTRGAPAARVQTGGQRHGGHHDGSDRGENERNAARTGAFGRRSFLKGAAAGAGGRRACTSAAWRSRPDAAPNAVSTENARPVPRRASGTRYEDSSIEGFATDISVNAGQTVSFKVVTDATAYRIRIYRMGWYQGHGARRVAEVMPSVPLPQNQPPP